MGNVKKERLKYVDVLRVLAMVPVVVCHYTRSQEYAGITYPNKFMPDEFFSIYLGSFGVAIFFILSGVSLMYTYDGKLDLKLFIKKRFLGIFPMYWMAWLTAFLYLFYKNKGFFNIIPRWKIIYTVIGMDGYFNWLDQTFYLLGEWFLGCLLLLYVLFPILKWGIEKHPYITAVIIIAVYFVGIRIYHGKIPSGNFFLFRVPEFAFGMYFVKYFKRVKLPVGIICTILLLLEWFMDLSRVEVVYKNTLVGISAFLWIVWICGYIKWDAFFNVCKKVGAYGYAVFLTHHFIIQEICYHFGGRVLGLLENCIMMLLCIVLVAWTSWLLVYADKKVKMLFASKK